jgi:hypothetical protein
MQVSNKIYKTTLENWKDLTPFQPKELKKLNKILLEKLKKSYLNNGKINPFTVWENNGIKYIIDGHSTKEVFELLESEGIEVEERFTCNYIELKNKSEAKKAVMIFNSKYKDMDGDFALDWLKEDIDLDIQKIMDETNISGMSYISKEQESEMIKEFKEEKLKENFRKVHILISCSIDKFQYISKIVETLKGMDFIEYEQSQN